MKTSIILINPWIYDFAAYDLWSKPLGLLSIGSFLRKCGFHVRLIDCMDVHHPALQSGLQKNIPKRRLYGTGKYLKNKVNRPGALKNIKRSFSCYGIPREVFQNQLNRLKKPSVFLVTSLMTYWYPGVNEAISIIKKTFPGVPVILGGIYARLCRDHALKHSGADIVSSEAEPGGVLRLLEKLGISQLSSIPESLSYPAFDLLNGNDYICLITSRGCPYRCRYCASAFLEPACTRRDPEMVFEEICYWHREKGIQDFAFYDDALLVNFKTHMGIVLEKLARRRLKVRFHTPNALHVKEITKNASDLMFRTGFKTIRLGLETMDFSFRNYLDNKVREGDFEKAMMNLLNAGFKRKNIGAYLLMGLPDQSVHGVSKTIEYVGNIGAMPYLAEYSPVPHTSLWDKAVSVSEYDLASEPLFHNNSLLSCWDDSRRAQVPMLRKQVLDIRERLRGRRDSE